MKKLGGIEIGGTKIQVVISGIEGRIENCYRFDVRKQLGAQGILEQIGSVLCGWKRHHLDIQGIGVAFGGPLDAATGRIICSHQIEGWENFDLASWVCDTFGQTRVVVENDANVAALGEARHGAGRGFDPVVYVTLGSGVGGGAIVQNRIYHGAAPGELEVGHLRLNKEGLKVEASCSGWAVDQKILAAIQGNPTGKLAELCAGMKNKQAKMLLSAIQAGDADAAQILKDTADDLALALSHVVHLIHPQAIIIGGGLSLMGEVLRQAIEQALPRYLMRAFQPGPRILLAQLGEQVVPVGALELVRS